jgi:2-polyprenyl-3-methyl-5-hydroxy-6-metoxy-1,4-benzoquinol methylase
MSIEVDDMEDENNTSLVTRILRFADAKQKRWKRQVYLDAKSYYRSYVANDIISPLNEQLIQDVMSYNPKSVFEFGCGVGKNLEILKGHVENLYGIDISKKAVAIATKKNLTVTCGDETELANIKNRDVVFTCSVLDHIKDIVYIINELKRIANIAIVIAETNTKAAKFYYPHDYESLGFVRTEYVYVSDIPKEPTYYIWHYKVK